MADGRPGAGYAHGCRVLLLAYPRAYRIERGEEILSTLIDAAGPGQRLPALADASDVLAAGLRQRLGIPSLAGFDAGLVAAAPIALTLAAGISAFAWWRVEPVSPGVSAAPALMGARQALAPALMGARQALAPALMGARQALAPAFLGAFRTIGPIAYLAWLIAAAARVLLPAAASRAAIAVATGVTVALPVLGAATGYDRPPLWVLMALTVFGILALSGSPIGTRSSVDERLGVAVGTFGVAAISSALVAMWPPAGGGFGYYYQPTIARVGAVAAGTVAGVAAYALIKTVRGGPSSSRGAGAQPWLWATALLALPAGWLGPFDSAGLRIAADSPAPHFGRLAQVLLATGAAAVTIAGLARRRTTVRDAQAHSLMPAGAATLGCATGLVVFLALGAQGWLGFAGRSSGLPGHVLVTLVALAAAGAAGLARPERVPGPKTGLRAFVAGLLVTVPAAWLVAAYDNGWTARGWPAFAHTAALVATLAFLPFALCVVAALRQLGARRRTPDAVAMLTISLAWVAYAAVPSVLSWGPVVVVLLTGGAVLGVTAVPRSRRGG
jgi:hypothetical protein